MSELASLTRRLAGTFAFCGVALRTQGAAARHHVATAPGIRATERTVMRAASLSKIVTGRVFAAAAAAAGLRRPCDVEAGELLGWPLRHPRFRGAPVTAGQIAAHCAGLTDETGYAVPADMSLEAFFAEDRFGPARPGTRFDYCNLGYVLIAAMAERLAGARFDRLAGAELARTGVRGGFNWSGIADRRDRLACHRPGAAGFEPQIDDAVCDTGVCGPDGREIDLAGHVPGRNPAPFSPQGGLRTSLDGCLALASALAGIDERPIWRPEMGETAGDAELHGAYGLGLRFLAPGALYPRPLVGHFASAYGLVGGAWWDAERRTAFAYLLNGAAEQAGDADDRFLPAERAIFAAVGRAA